jgi:mRNA-degrading endonuclease RelE of RelBE toxin-antitoxin system
MGSYEIRWKSSAAHDLHSIDPQQIPRIIRAIESLAANPFPSQHRKIRGSVRDYRIGLEIIELSTRCTPDPELSSFIISGIADTRIAGD